ncbi:hypothetical protein BAUCODRAFT_39621 [Baudoinia panamericana UAMH 10762]|uniref:DUF4267 domain-containing protein n=1 Tax=Baudoinia panamericana (strain UAMH 10762) TaxID=717646 RepID=M2LBZ8_BAUPA|nr:uncharacterized protein BAUCODRAFT_39621 [Baudoinia panamericana UAMH 10762]EMC91442.1 hypothetical protein BAUCODRAFT_39621 [Baudoinia panamericana UAMH 10762]
MATTANLNFIADNVARLFGIMLIGLGTTTQFRPLEGARVFAGSIATDEKAALFFPIVGARNISLGLAMLILGLQGQRNALGTLIAVFTLSGGIDAWWCARNNSEKWAGHAIATATGVPLSWWLLSH